MSKRINIFFGGGKEGRYRWKIVIVDGKDVGLKEKCFEFFDFREMV